MRRRTLARALFGLGAFACVGPGHGAPVGADPLALLDAELGSIANDAGKPLASLSVLAIRGGRVVYERQFGRRHIARDGGGRPADAATLYRVASVSKLVTTLGVMRLVEAGKLDLDADVSGYLGWPLRHPRFAGVAITLRHLLSHRSSLLDDAGYHTFGAEIALRDVLQPGGRHHGDGRMWSGHAPGTYFRYANLPWGVVAGVMESVTGEAFDPLMRRLVLEPLGLGGAYDAASLSPARRDDLATLYRKATAGDVQQWDPAGPWIAQIDDHELPLPPPRTPPGYVPGANGMLGSPQGGLRASAADLGRVMLMLMDDGLAMGRTFLSKASLGTMFARHWASDGGANGERDYGTKREVFHAWGLGNQHFVGHSGPARGDRLVADGSFRAVGHHGDAYGLQSLFAFDPEARHGIVVLIGGTGFDPALDPGAWSWAPRYEERIVDALWRRAIQGRTD